MNEIRELYYKKELSTRSLNVCHINQLDSLKKIKKHYSIHGNFIELKNCGSKTNLELIVLCKKYKDIKSLANLPEFKEDNLTSFLTELSEAEKLKFSNYTKQKLAQLDNRTKNAINQYLSYNFSLEHLIEKQVLKQHFPIENIKGLGKKGVVVAKKVFAELRDDLQNHNFKEFPIEKNASLKILKHIPKEAFSTGVLDPLKYFKTVAYMLTNKQLFTPNEVLVIQHHLILTKNSFFLNPSLFLEKHHLTNKEVNSITASVLKKFKLYFSFLKEFKTDFEVKNKISSKEDYISYADYLYDEIRDLHKVNFTNAFISYLIGEMFSETHKNIGYHKTCLSKLLKKQIKPNSSYHFKTYHQVNKKIVKKCNFSALISFINTEKINLSQLKDNEKIELVSMYSNSYLDKNKLQLANCVEQIIAKEKKS